ncbi:MAG: TRAP transporter large permease subunit [Alsobacter sp.]
MSGVFGFVLLAAVAVGMVATGLPAFMVVFACSVAGAAVSLVAGWASPEIYAALPNRVVNLLESDILQALPLFVFLGALLGRLPVGAALFRAAVAIAPRSRAAPALAGIGLGALLGPMNGSVGASVLALSRTLAPALSARGVPKPLAAAIVTVASTLGVVVPPSLVLILLGDAMMAAHTIAVNATGRSDRIINTQDVFRGALAPALAFVALSMGIAWLSARRIAAEPAAASHQAPLQAGEAALAAAALLFVTGLLAGVALGFFYAVEAAAFGAVALFIAAAATGRLGGGALGKLLDEVIAATGALFALLVAATTLTLVLRVLGTDKLVMSLLRAMPGGDGLAAAIVLGILGISALVLDAFEIIFVIVPILAPPLLERASDAVWVAVLILLVLQTSFMAPPFGYALMLVQATARDRVPHTALWRALAPFLAAQAGVLLLVFVWPACVHLLDPRPAAGAPAPLSDKDVQDRFRAIAPPDEDGPPALNLDPKAP